MCDRCGRRFNQIMLLGSGMTNRLLVKPKASLCVNLRRSFSVSPWRNRSDVHVTFSHQEETYTETVAIIDNLLLKIIHNFGIFYLGSWQIICNTKMFKIFLFLLRQTYSVHTIRFSYDNRLSVWVKGRTGPVQRSVLGQKSQVNIRICKVTGVPASPTVTNVNDLPVIF